MNAPSADADTPVDTPADRAAALIASRQAGDFCPPWLPGTIDLPTALELQLAILDHHLAAGGTVGGWKVGLTSEASRRRLGADERPFGFVLAERTLTTPATVDASAIRQLSIETEMCFEIGADVTDPTVGPHDILDFVSSVAAGFELNEARPSTAPFDFAAMVTDCLTNWGIVQGQPAPVADANTLSQTEIEMRRNGELVFAGVSADHVDDHTVSLCRLVEQLGRHGQMLRGWATGDHRRVRPFPHRPRRSMGRGLPRHRLGRSHHRLANIRTRLEVRHATHRLERPHQHRGDADPDPAEPCRFHRRHRGSSTGRK